MAKTSFSPNRLLLVHAHPDDESLFTGHIMADALARGAEVFLLTLTRGERGKVKLADLKPLEGRNNEMGAFRTAELYNAIAEYQTETGSIQHEFAGTRHYLDSGLRINSFGKPTRKRILDEMSLAAVATAVVADDIQRVMERFKPDAVITYNSRGGFGHPDHKKAYDATALAIRHYSKKRKAPKFWTIAEPRERFDVAVGGKKTAAVKKAALSAHASQVLINEDTYALVAGQEVRFDAPEHLRRARATSWNSVKPLLRSLWALPLGYLIGLAGTILHLSRTTDGAPIGLALALVIVTALAIPLRLMRRSRGALYLYALAFAVTILQLTKPGQHTTGLSDQQLTTFWVWGSLSVLAVVVIFPRLRKATWDRGTSGHR
jgi:N-acetyl-1-D-myo-inositol-2-amino-2-deoxy-alpha-D-glucopyranoside deacetylase